MHKTPLYIHPVIPPNIPYSQMHFWDAAVNDFDNNQYPDALTHLINYVNKNILGKKKLSRNSEISHPHGSSVITIKVTASEIIITAPFLKTSKANKIALYRRVSEINFHPLTLARIKLNNELLWFEYRTPIELSQPNKIYDVLREICVFADDFDDTFIKKFNAKFYIKPIIEHFTPDRDLQIYHDIQAYVSNGLEMIEAFEQKRLTGFSWESLTTTCFKIVDMHGIQGVLRTELEDKIMFLRHNDRIELENRISQIKGFFQQMKAQTFDEMSKNFYGCDYFISTKFRSSLPIIQQFLKPYQQQKTDEIRRSNTKAAFFTMYYAFLALIYDYNIDKEHFSIITNALDKTSEVSWESGMETLDNLLDKFMTGRLGFEKPNIKKGFFAKLFGN